MMEVSGKLPIGFAYGGKLYQEFTLRPALLKDNIEAIEECGPDASNLRLGVAVLVRQIVKLGDIPKTAITTSLVMQMHEEDYDALDRASEALTRKLKARSMREAA